MFHYTVRCQFTGNAQLADHWLAWLKDHHIDDVLRCGATSAEIVRMDEEVVTYEVRYTFPSRETFAAYEADEAPRLRQEALELFPVEQGISYQRSTGETIWSAIGDPESRPGDASD